jgi:predicted dehydrogenase
VEKPVSVLASDGFKVAGLAAKKKLFVGVDFQFTSYPHSVKLKELICNGELGELREVVGVMEWKRTEEYYERADWVGKRYYDGLPCWDGVLMNQAVHLVNSALEMGTTEKNLAVPQRVQAEMYRAHNIETEDLAAFRADLGEASLYLYATTCCDEDYRTTVEIIGTKGRASWDLERAVVKIAGKDEIVFEEPSDRNAIHHNLVACIRGVDSKVLAPASEALKPTLTINGAYASAGMIPKVSWDQMAGLRELMDAAAEERKLLCEMPGVDWGSAGEMVEVSDLARFSGLSDDDEVRGR